ncbi:MAG: nucleoside hydrolase [Ruminococcaceae bacterium]|nr:nucleoside hydrolase [Oscillospiraceae bacterium]
MEKRKIIMDVDTGSDDAMALVMAMLDERFDLLGITAVNGNVEVKLTTMNSLRVVECCDKQDEVKVYKGCDLPIASTLMPWGPQATQMPGFTNPLPHREGTREQSIQVHTDHLPLPVPKIKEEPESAVVFLIKTLLAAEDGEITLVPVGPLTNIAIAMRADPRIIPKIKEIMIMGGGHDVNNSSPAAEFNIWVDPEALEIVLQSGCKITLVPLDATHKCFMTVEESERIRAIGTKPAILIADLVKQRATGYAQMDAEMKALNGAPLHDALAVCALVIPEVLKNVVHVNCHVDISKGIAYGQTIIDQRIRVNPTPKNCYFAFDADKDIFVKWMIDVLEKDKAKRGL